MDTKEVTDSAELKHCEAYVCRPVYEALVLRRIRTDSNTSQRSLALPLERALSLCGLRYNSVRRGPLLSRCYRQRPGAQAG